MANEPENTVANQISELRSQLSSLSSQLADRLGTATDKADNALSSASSVIEDVASNARHQGERVLQAARENPGTATATLAAVGILGVLAGMILGRCRR